MTAADRAAAHRAIAAIYDQVDDFESAANRLWDALPADVRDESQPALSRFSTALRKATAEAIGRLDPGPVEIDHGMPVQGPEADPAFAAEVKTGEFDPGVTPAVTDQHAAGSFATTLVPNTETLPEDVWPGVMPGFKPEGDGWKYGAGLNFPDKQIPAKPNRSEPEHGSWRGRRRKGDDR